ncbi:putative glutamate carboxypeptidase 2 [Acorus calamus]|uniref:Glutamate carboxypeptidase 2 n=1 Tax=Acorus calamus TaxID=4465 RepID=A0AAV9CMV9_ACOCL|nr:putative glutamate carboxypeptidase 2 [Acorus calamus]
MLPFFKHITTTLFTLLTISTIYLTITSQPPNKHTYHSIYALTPDNETVSRHLYALTRRPHLAGTEPNSETARYVLSAFNSYNAPAHQMFYEVSLSYPVHRSLTLSSDLSTGAVVQFSLTQEVYPGDPYVAEAAEVVPTFHAYAPTASVIGPAVYVNYGRAEDYDALHELGVNVSGAVVLARYGKIFRGDIVGNAYEAGAVGAVVYTDRKDYGGEVWFPDGRLMPPTGVQIGTVYWAAGDPSTPGWASRSGCERIEVEEMVARGDLPRIPSLPVSAVDGEAIMRAIGGPVAGDDWQGGDGGVVYRVGPGPGVLNLTYIGNQTLATIQNVFAVIKGVEEPDSNPSDGIHSGRYVLLGNHRDAWTFGAVDPNSGTAALLEIGSTEWVEENREMLKSKVVAYLNVDCAVSGPGFHASATPQLDDLLKQAAQQVQDPDNSSQTIYDSWIASKESSQIGRLGGGGSDYAAFVQHVGVPSVDMFFGGGKSCIYYVVQFVVETAASIWGLVALKLADEEVLPFNYISYASELLMSTKELEHELLGEPISLTSLFKSIEELEKAAIKINNEKKIYAPSKHNDYGSKSFPGIDDAVEKAKKLKTTESWHFVQHEIWRVSRAVTQASLVLNGEFT